MGRARRRRPIEGDAGYTLVEVVVAVLISAIMVTAVFSTALTSKTSSGKSDRRLIASQAARQLTSRLRQFVTGCGCDINTGICPSPQCTTILGPTNRAGVASWYLNDPTGSPAITDSMGDVWAMRCGQHTVTGLLPAWFEAAPYNARLVYTVSNCAGGDTPPLVTVNVPWTEP